MSKPYILTYDLNTPGQDYNKLHKIIEDEISTGTWCHCWDSTYVFRSELSAWQIMHKLENYVDVNDRVFVSEIPSGMSSNYSGWLTDNELEYIKKNILDF